MKTKHEISAGGIVFRERKAKNVKHKIYKNTEYSILNTEYCFDWLICQHSFHKGWVFPKGLVGDEVKGEKMEQAALREVEEEGGVKAKIIYSLKIPYKYYYKFEGILINKSVYYFLMEYISGDPKNHDFEMIEAKFISENEIKKLLTYPSEKKAFEDAIKIFRELKIDK